MTMPRTKKPGGYGIYNKITPEESWADAWKRFKEDRAMQRRADDAMRQPGRELREREGRKP